MCTLGLGGGGMNYLSFFEYYLMHLNWMPTLPTLCITGKLDRDGAGPGTCRRTFNLNSLELCLVRLRIPHLV